MVFSTLFSMFYSKGCLWNHHNLDTNSYSIILGKLFKFYQKHFFIIYKL